MMGPPESNSVSDAEVLRRKEDYDELWIVELLAKYGPVYFKKLKERYNGELDDHEIDDVLQEFATKQVIKTQETKREKKKVDNYDPSLGNNLCNYYMTDLIHLGVDYIRKKNGRGRGNKKRKVSPVPPRKLANEVDHRSNNNSQRANGDPVESAVNNEAEMAFWNILDRYHFEELEKKVLTADWKAGGTADSKDLADQLGVPIDRIYNIRCRARKKLQKYFKMEGYDI